MKYFENYIEIRKQKPVGLRDQLRTIALDGLSILDKLKGIDILLNKPRVQFLYLHHVFKEEEIKLDRLLKMLSLNHQFISYSEGVDKVLENSIDKPYICFSLDDGFKNNLRAAEILNEYNAKACFFVNPSIVGLNTFNEIEKHCFERLQFPPVEFLNWNDIEKLQNMGHEIGSHTMDHIDIANTEEDVFIEDCKKTFDILLKQCGEVNHFALPYGRFGHFNEVAREIVFNSGFKSCATAERGCHINHDRLLLKQELCIRRDHIVLDWKTDHIIHFIAKNSKRATIANNLFPYLK
ncbi:MAG: polysaccharide deacetylase family protein [Paludibacter sp.]